jgi:hypothetical protein
VWFILYGSLLCLPHNCNNVSVFFSCLLIGYHIIFHSIFGGCVQTEKNELRDEKSRLKAEKERLEQQVKAMTIPTGYMPHPAAVHAAAAAFAAQSQAASNKAAQMAGYPGMAMWQWMPPAAVDTSQDHVLRPPVA